MVQNASWQEIVASSLDWDQAHVTLEAALKGLSPADRGRIPPGQEHSVWQIVEHIRIAQADLLSFCRDMDYSHDMTWPDDYWPRDPAPNGDAGWNRSVDALISDRNDFKEFTTSAKVDLTAAIPHGTGQTYLRTILVEVDHAAYHIGQIVEVRRMLGAWPAA